MIHSEPLTFINFLKSFIYFQSPVLKIIYKELNGELVCYSTWFLLVTLTGINISFMIIWAVTKIFFLREVVGYLLLI